MAAAAGRLPSMKGRRPLETVASGCSLLDDLTKATKAACWAAPQSAHGFEDTDLVETARLEALCDGVFAFMVPHYACTSKGVRSATSATRRPFPLGGA